jgi:hypothetical protein
LEITWNKASEDLDLELIAPPDYHIIPGSFPWLCEGVESSYFTGKPRESLIFLGGPTGSYLLTSGLSWSISTPVIVNARLYGPTGALKENLGYYEVTPDEFAYYPLLAILDYDN